MLVRIRRRACAAPAMDETTTRWLRTFTQRRRIASPNLETLEPCPREALDVARLVWHRRVVNETRSVELARKMRQLLASMSAFADCFDEALVRLENDEAAHVELATNVLQKLDMPSFTIPADATTIVLPNEPRVVSLMRLVVTGLCICESVSASRFASVREHTDLDGYRACIDLFYRDELTHAELGFVLLPHVARALHDEMGSDQGKSLLLEEMRSTLGQMDRVVGLNFEREGGLPPPRPQPKMNPGVVEPAVDAAAFYRSMHDDVLPRLESLGFSAQQAWKTRRTW